MSTIELIGNHKDYKILKITTNKDRNILYTSETSKIGFSRVFMIESDRLTDEQGFNQIVQLIDKGTK